MLKISILFVIFVTVNFSHVQSEFVTLWTPKFVQEDAEYRLFILPSGITQKTEVAVQFRTTNASYMLTDGKLSAVEYASKQRNFGNITSLDLTMTLYRNVSTSSGVQMQCSTKSIDVQTSTGNFHNFIQTDKPIYKPGDEVQFRILTVDKDLKPFHRNSINVTITDPAGRAIWNFQNQAGKFVGVFDEKFTLSTSTTLGDWKITVIVDKKAHMATSKIFAVQKYILPLFDAHIDMPERHVLKDDDLTLSVYGKYSFGEYVKGNAELVIRRAADKFEYSKDKFTNVLEPKNVKKNLKTIGVETLNKLQLEAFLVFTEPESGMHFNKTVTFYAHNDQRHKLTPVHAEKFLPGFPFTMKVFIYDWKNEQIMSHFEKIELTYSYKLTNGSTGTISSLGQLKNGVFVNEFEVPLSYTEMSVEVRFPNSDSYRKRVEKGSVNVGINSLVVSHLPENPQIYDIVKIFVTSDRELKDVLMAVVTRYGNTKTKQISCNGKLLCDFEVKIEEEMMPHSTIMVYDVKDQQTIFQGQTVIVTENLGRNHLTVELPTTKAKTKEDVDIKFTTKAKSKIYLLAFDKRLTSLREGNDITKNDVVQSVADYDGENKILVHDMPSWKVCTPEEVERLESGRTYVTALGGTDTYFPDEPDDDEVVYDRNPPDSNDPETGKDLLRERFPETWIFETIEVGSKSTIEKTFTTPDSMTTWLVSAFSVHNDHGIALAPAQELIVMEDFFVEINLPYSIRYTEVLKLEVLVFNYVKTKEEITVDLKLNNLNDGKEFQFVEYSESCQPSYHDGTVASSKVTVPANGVKKVHFYIRSHPKNSEFDEKKMKMMTIDVESTAKTQSGDTYRDHIRKKLIVDPVGIKVYMVLSDFFKLNGGTTDPHIQQANFSQDLSNIDVVVTGDYLTDTMNLEQQLAIFPSDCLEQRTTKFKRNVDTYRYLEAKKKNPPTKHFTEQYQGILNKLKSDYSYRDKAWYRAYLGNILATAMTSGAIPEDKKVLFETLDIVKNLQENNGTFSNFDFYYGFPVFIQDDSYKYSERYFSAAYCLIPFVRYKTFLDDRYNDFIEKGFRYLDKEENRLQVMRYGLSVAAYVYALDNQREKAETLLRDIERAYYQYDNHRRCYKIFEGDAGCEISHTTFVALTYLALNDIVRAEPIVYYLLDKKQYYDYYQFTSFLAIVTEPIAEMGFVLHTDDTDMKIALKNEQAFSQEVYIDKSNSATPQTVEMPTGSEKVISTISGIGYCTISVIFERIVVVPQINNVFSLSIEKGNEIANGIVLFTVKVCATYNQQSGMKPVLVNVVYEVEMPSGYVFVGVKDKETHHEIKEVTTQRQDTLVNLFYGDFKADKNYCVELKAMTISVVNEPVNAGVKVYDYDNKERVAVDFYKFTSKGC